MKAAVCRAFGRPLVIEDVELAAPGPGEVRVDVAACAICHSDIYFAEGAWGGTLPAVYGHEAAGVVAEVGPNVDSVRPGDHVAVSLVRSCGRCHYCALGRPTCCETSFPLDARSPLRGRDGEVITHGLRTGAFAEAVVVEASQVVAVPDDMPFDRVALLSCGVITGFGAVATTAQVPAGASVAVIGLGGVGLNCVQGAALRGAGLVLGIDVVAAKLAAGRQFGATDTLDGRDPELAARVRELTGGRGLDFVFVATGVRAAFAQAFELLARGGAVVFVGMPASGVTTEIDPGGLASANQRILGCKMGETRLAVDIPALAGLYRQGRLKLDELISGRYPLAEINEAMAAVGRGKAIRNVIMF